MTQQRRVRARALLEDLEPRILYSADHPAGLVLAALHDAQTATHQLVHAPATLGSTTADAQAHRATELVFIDGGVAHAQQLAADIAAQAAAGRPIEAILLDPHHDGIDQITAALATRHDIGAIHLISHGSEASVQLGSTRLDGNELMLRAGDIASWGSHLARGADLMIYGCDVGEGSDGQALVNDLAHLTGANVAASSDLTGNTALGADWTLEVHSGKIDAASALDATGQAAWMGTLAANTSPRFGNSAGGSTTLDMGTSNDMATAVLVQPDGKIILGGYTSSNFALARYQRDGTLDTSFGTAGKVTTDFGATDAAYGMVLQPDGKIILAGSSNGDVAVARYNADGSLDTSFGTSGKTTININGTDTGAGVALQSDGKIVIVGSAHVGSFDEFAAVRLTTSGALDTTFNSTGKVTTAVGTGLSKAYAVAVQPDGKIVLTGTQVPNGASYENTSVVRYNSDGSLDTTFNSTGIAIVSVSTQTDSGNAITLQSDGKIVVVGNADSTGANGFDISVLRFNTNGTLDTTFSGDGMQTTDFGGGSNGDYGGGVAVQPDGKIIASGDAYQSSTNYDFAVARYNSDGSLDTSFGTSGKATRDLTNNYDLGAPMALQSDGRIVVAGRSGGSGAYNFGVARFNPDGTIDTSFAAGTSTIDGTAAYTENNAAVVLDSSITLTDAELNSAGNYGGGTITLASSGGANSDDHFSASGSLSALTEGGSLVYGGTTIGTVTTNSAGTLLLTFNSSATQSLVNSTLQSIAYLNSNDNPPTSAQINWTFSDGNTGSQGTGGALTAAGYTTVNITATNDAPVVTPVAPALTTITEDQTGNAGQTVASIVGSSITDPDNGALGGIAITASVSGNGTWQYSTNGGSSWTALGTPTNTAALLLRSTDYLRFVPNAQNATSGSITYRGWDQTSGTFGSTANTSTNGGSTAFSSATDTASITVSAVNDAPVLAAIAPTLATITEDQTANGGELVSSFIGSSITDIDSGAVQGIAITTTANGTGTWQFSTNGGTSWSNVGAVGATSALLLRSTDYVRFVPDGANGTTASIGYRAWDQSGATAASRARSSTRRAMAERRRSAAATTAHRSPSRRSTTHRC